MLPSKLTSGMPFKSSVVRCVNAILDYLKTQRIVGDNRTIQVTQGTAGLMLSVHPTFSSAKAKSTKYNGWFKVTLATVDNVTTLSVTDGVCYYNGKKVDCAGADEIAIAPGYLCVNVSKSANAYTVTYSIEAVIPDMPTLASLEDDNTVKYPLALVSGTVETGFAVEQLIEYEIPQLWCFGSCTTT